MSLQVVGSVTPLHSDKDSDLFSEVSSYGAFFSLITGVSLFPKPCSASKSETGKGHLEVIGVGEPRLLLVVAAEAHMFTLGLNLANTDLAKHGAVFDHC